MLRLPIGSAQASPVEPLGHPSHHLAFSRRSVDSNVNAHVSNKPRPNVLEIIRWLVSSVHRACYDLTWATECCGTQASAVVSTTSLKTVDGGSTMSPRELGQLLGP